MKITISLTQLLRGVYADAALMSASMEVPSRPALLRYEHDLALRRTAVSAWTTLMAEILPFVRASEFTGSEAAGSGEPDYLSVELEGAGAEAHGAAIRLQLETALERRVLAIAYRKAFPDVSAANEVLSAMAVRALVRLAEPCAPAVIAPSGGAGCDGA